MHDPFAKEIAVTVDWTSARSPQGERRHLDRKMLPNATLDREKIKRPGITRGVEADGSFARRGVSHGGLSCLYITVILHLIEHSSEILKRFRKVHKSGLQIAYLKESNHKTLARLLPGILSAEEILAVASKEAWPLTLAVRWRL